MAARIFLAIFGLFSLPYGIYCFVDPAFLAPFAGVAATTTTGVKKKPEEEEEGARVSQSAARAQH